MSVAPEDRGEPAETEPREPATDAEKLELLLETFRRADGERWTLREIENATGEVVSASYLSSIRKRRIKRVGTRQRRAMARVMGFPIELWDAEPEQWPQVMKEKRREAASGQAPAAPVADLLEDLFRFARHPLTGSSFTERAVAELSGGELTEDEVRMIRQGKITDPPESKLLALSDVFRVPRSYWYRPRRVPVLDEETERFLSGPSRLRALHMKLLDLPKERREQISDTIEELVDRARKQMKEEERRRRRADSSQGNT
jgi:transcriptional regulator with XRE-family HTH domain